MMGQLVNGVHGVRSLCRSTPLEEVPFLLRHC